MICIAIIDDEPLISKMISDLIRAELTQNDEIKIIVFSSAESFLEEVNKEMRFDIALCDIEMNGMDGIMLGRILRKKQIGIYLIFLTSYSQFAADSYKINAYQYILKEEMGIRLPKILKPLIEKVNKKNNNYKMFEKSNKKERTYYSDIIYIYKEKGTKYVYYVTTEKEYKERITLEEALKQFESKNCRDFILVERGIIVNIKHINKIEKNIIYLTNNYQVNVSRTHVKTIKELINICWS